ncbi:MAG: hypothetical protein RR795_01400 [Cetobacterium sp.]|uniref:hypothetical protein n=1 Tax=Cetobacterium sp. TaxID=2071632 RepID=UPI002FC9F11D
MAYDSKKDIVTLNGLVFSNVFKSDFAPTRNGDAWTREMDSNGSYEDFKNPDNSGTVPFSVRNDAKSFLKELRRLMDSGDRFILKRNNMNKSGAEETYTGCLVVNDGSSGRGANGVLANREWTVSYESYNINEGKN